MSKINKLFFCCALYIEAKPIINYFNLKNKFYQSKIQFLCNAKENIYLAISGTGKISSSIATTIFCEKFKATIQNMYLINIGFAGAKNKKIGDFFLINKITDQDTDKNYYPDNLNFQLKKEECICVSKNNFQEKSIIEMESSGFFQAAQIYTKLHKIIIIKMITDNNTQKIINKENTEKIWNKEIPKVLKKIVGLPIMNNYDTFTKTEEEIIEQFITSKRMTFTEKIMFRKKLKNQKIKNQDWKNLLN